MNRSLWVLLLFISLSCNQDQDKNKSDNSKKLQKEINNSKRISGDFITVDTAAVIKSNSQIYGVILDSIGKVLNQRSKEVQREQYEMIPVEVKAQIIANDKKDQWEKLLKIDEIIYVNATVSNQQPNEINISTNN